MLLSESILLFCSSCRYRTRHRQLNKSTDVRTVKPQKENKDARKEGLGVTELLNSFIPRDGLYKMKCRICDLQKHLVTKQTQKFSWVEHSIAVLKYVSNIKMKG